MIYQHRKSPIIHFIIVVFILVIQVTIVSAQNFNDSEIISAWSITTQSPVETTTSASIKQSLDSWNIQQAIVLAATENNTPSSPSVEEITASMGNGGGGRLGTANYALRNRSQLVTIARNIAKAEKEAFIQHASAPKKDTEYTKITSKTVPDQEILKNSYIPEIKIEQESSEIKQEVKNVTIISRKSKEEITSKKYTSTKKTLGNEDIATQSLSNVIESIKQNIPEDIIIDSPQKKELFPLSSRDNIEQEIHLYNKKLQQKKYQNLIFSVVETVFSIFIVLLGIMILIQKGILSKKKSEKFLSKLLLFKKKYKYFQ